MSIIKKVFLRYFFARQQNFILVYLSDVTNLLEMSQFIRISKYFYK